MTNGHRKDGVPVGALAAEGVPRSVRKGARPIVLVIKLTQYAKHEAMEASGLQSVLDCATDMDTVTGSVGQSVRVNVPATLGVCLQRMSQMFSCERNQASCSKGS